MSLNKKILIIFGVLFLGTLLFVPYVNATTPKECRSLAQSCVGSVCISFPRWDCKKVASGETENFDLYSTKFLIKNNAQSPYFIPYLTFSEREAFLNSAIANPSISVTPDIGSMCFKRCAKEGSKTVCNVPEKTYVFYAARYIGLSSGTTGASTMTPSKTRYNYRLVKDSTPCKNSVFGDPWQGETKYCYYPIPCPEESIDSNDDGEISISEYTEAVKTGSVSEDELNEVADAFVESGSHVIMRSTFEYGGHIYTVYKGAETGTVVVYRDNDEGVSDENALFYKDTNGDGVYEWYNTTSGTFQPLSGSTGDPNHTTFDDAVNEAEEGIDRCRYVYCGSGEYCDSNTGTCKRYSDTSESSSGSSNICTGCSYTPPAGIQCYSTYTYPC